MFSLLSASPLRDSKLTMIDSKLTNQNASFTCGRSQNLRLTGDGIRAGGFSVSPPPPTPLSLAVSPLVQDGAGDSELRVFRGFSAIKTPSNRLQAC